LMIPHHEGAVRMVDDLLEQSGSAYDPILYDFMNDIVNDQKVEITRMNALFSGLSTDQRVGLKAGFRDAGEAALNLKLIKTHQDLMVFLILIIRQIYHQLKCPQQMISLQVERMKTAGI